MQARATGVAAGCGQVTHVTSAARHGQSWHTLLLLGVFAFPLSAQAEFVEDLAGLQALEREVGPALDDPSSGTPFYLHAESRDRQETGDAALYLPHPFTALSEALEDIANWCDILPLHLNVKGCTHGTWEGQPTLSVYVGLKTYQAPENAFLIAYEFDSEESDSYLRVTLSADEGPLGTSDYRIVFEAMPVGERSFGRVRISERQSWVSEKAAKLYLSTRGAGKQGLTVVGQDDAGNPVYSSGSQGAIERNVLRYYFTVVAYLDRSGDTPEARYRSSLEHWFDATEQYPQLHELEREEYLTYKRRERQDQIRLQAGYIGAGP